MLAVMILLLIVQVLIFFALCAAISTLNLLARALAHIAMTFSAPAEVPGERLGDDLDRRER